jgi:hypothetical protein
MHRRRLLQLIGLIAGGSALSVGSGAFTSVSGQRTVDIAVADDDDAYLDLDGNSEFLRTTTSSGQLRFFIPGLDPDTGPGGDSPDGSGVNPSSSYTFADLFTVTNRGEDPVELYSRASGLPQELHRLAIVGGPNNTLLAGEGNAIELAAGDQISAGLFIEMSDTDTSKTVETSITIVADPSDESNPSEPWIPESEDDLS